MRRFDLAAVAAAALLVLSGCGKDGSTNSSGGSSSPSAPAVTEAQLKAALLTEADLGEGWKALPTESESPDSESPDPAQTGCEFEGEFGVGNTVAETSVEFEQESGNFLSQEVEAYKPGKAAASIEEARDFFKRCMAFDNAELEARFTVTNWDGAPALGDESLAKKMTAKVGQISMVGAMIVIRKGDVLTALLAMGLKSPEAFLLPAAQTAATRLPG